MAVIIGGPKPMDRQGHGGADDMADESDGGPKLDDMAKMRAGKALIRAIESKDPGAVADAFEQLSDACGGYDEGE